jgi:D-psicose/D-tagatose/L-ribulose 3-epimerase
MKLGMNLLLWTGDMHDGLLPVLEQLKKMGYDGVEIPVFDLHVEKYALWGKRLKDLGLACTGVTVRTAADNPISPDAKIRAAGVAKNKLTLDCCQAAGAEALIGPYHSALGEFSGAGPTKDEWRWGVDSMREVAEHAAKVGVLLGVEYLNRFETYLLNCAVDAVRFIKDVNHPNCRTMYDTFHANIEEKSPAQAIRTIAPYAVQCHISENDRSTPGQGNIPWKQTFDTLKEVGYNGWMTVEAFGLALPELVAATKIWRRMYDSEEQLARDALAFMKRETAARGM